MRPDAMKVNLFSKISVRNFRVKFQHHRCIKDPVLIPEIHQTLVPLSDRTDGGGSRAEAVMFGRAEPPIFLDRRMAAGVVNGDHDVTGILLGADADKRRAVRTFPTGVEGIFQKIAEDRAELWLTQRERGRKLDADRKIDRRLACLLAVIADNRVDRIIFTPGPRGVRWKRHTVLFDVGIQILRFPALQVMLDEI